MSTLSVSQHQQIKNFHKIMKQRKCPSPLDIHVIQPLRKITRAILVAADFLLIFSLLPAFTTPTAPDNLQRRVAQNHQTAVMSVQKVPIVGPKTLPPFSDDSRTAPSLAPTWDGHGYVYGQCTYYVAHKRPIPSNWGNARDWLANAQKAGFVTGEYPHAGAIAWTPAGRWGHVAYVEQVNGMSVLVSEMNYVAWNRVTTRWVNAGAFKYIY